MVRALLAVHRDLTWGDVQCLLRILADPDIRIRHAEPATFEEKDGWKRGAIPLQPLPKVPAETPVTIPLTLDLR